jgi:photosystem II cytochrome c550
MVRAFAICVALMGLQTASAFAPGFRFVPGFSAASKQGATLPTQDRDAAAAFNAMSAPQAVPETSSIAGSVAPLIAGVCIGLAALFGAPGSALADVEDTPIPADASGKTIFITKDQLIRGKRLFLAACSSCHVGGGTRTNQNVGLAAEELAGANPARDNIAELVKFQNEPLTYDGLKDISEVHPSIKSADVFPKMRTMKQVDLYDISLYILYQGITIPEKWGGGKIYY